MRWVKASEKLWEYGKPTVVKYEGCLSIEKAHNITWCLPMDEIYWLDETDSTPPQPKEVAADEVDEFLRFHPEYRCLDVIGKFEEWCKKYKRKSHPKPKEVASEEYANEKQPNPSPNDAPFYTTADRWQDIKESFEDGRRAMQQPVGGWISVEERENLTKIRNYFGGNDKTTFEHFAYSVIDRLIKSLPQPPSK